MTFDSSTDDYRVFDVTLIRRVNRTVYVGDREQKLGPLEGRAILTTTAPSAHYALSLLEHMLVSRLHRIEMDLLAHGPEDRRQVEDATRGQLPPAHGGGRVVEPGVEVEDDSLPPWELLHHHATDLLVLSQRPLGDARQVVDEEEDLEADAADAVARCRAHGVEEVARAVEVEGVEEEERVFRVEEVLCLVVDLPVDGQQLARRSIVAHPAGAHGESSISAAGGEGVSAIVDHDQRAVHELIGNRERVVVDLETEFGRQSEEMSSLVIRFGILRDGFGDLPSVHLVLNCPTGGTQTIPRHTDRGFCLPVTTSWTREAQRQTLHSGF